jgi:hypothetical protein
VKLPPLPEPYGRFARNTFAEGNKLHTCYTEAQLLAYRAAVIEMCAKKCDDYANTMWSLYKGRLPFQGNEEGRADPDVQGRSDGASNCADAIWSLLK